MSDGQTLDEVRQAALKLGPVYIDSGGTKRCCKPDGQYAELLDSLTKAAVEYATSRGMSLSDASSLIYEAAEYMPILFKALVSPSEE
jgi:hypothetical protein